MGTSNFADCDHLRQHSANLKAAQSHKVVKVRSIFLDTTPVDIRSLVGAIYFKEARTPLSVTDLLHYNATLGLLLDGCNNLEDIVVNAPRNSGEPTARLMALLPMIPGLALRQITLKRGVYQQLPLERLFQRVAHNLRTLLLSQVRVPGANLETLVQIWRDSPVLRMIRIQRISVAQPGAVGPCYVSTSAAIRRSFCNTAAANRPEILDITRSIRATWMVGPVGRQLGMNQVLRLRGSNLYDPTLTVEAMKADGRLS